MKNILSKISSIFKIPLNNKIVSNTLMKYSENIPKIANEKILEKIKSQYPKTYQKFMLKNSSQINDLKKTIIQKYEKSFFKLAKHYRNS